MDATPALITESLSPASGEAVGRSLMPRMIPPPAWNSSSFLSVIRLSVVIGGRIMARNLCGPMTMSLPSMCAPAMYWSSAIL